MDQPYQLTAQTDDKVWSLGTIQAMACFGFQLELEDTFVIVAFGVFPAHLVFFLSVWNLPCF